MYEWLLKDRDAEERNRQRDARDMWAWTVIGVVFFGTLGDRVAAAADRGLSRLSWWARQDSNLEPDGYEPPALTIELRAPARLMPDHLRVRRSRTSRIPSSKHQVSPSVRRADRPLLHDPAARAKRSRRRPCSDTKLVSHAACARACEDFPMRSLTQALAVAALLVAAALMMARPGMAADDDNGGAVRQRVGHRLGVGRARHRHISAGVLTEGDTARDALSAATTSPSPS